MNGITVSSCAKLILFGEHAVLHGCPAVAIPVFRNAAKISFKPNNGTILTLQGVADLPEKAQKVMQSDLLSLREYFETNISGDIEIQFNIPPGSGLGASAAWSVCLARLIQKITHTPETLLDSWLQITENTHHGGKASGIDHTTIWHEKPVILRSGKNPKPTELPEALQTMKKNMFIFFTGIPTESTSQMIQHVSTSIKQKDTQEITKQFDTAWNSQMTMAQAISLINTAGKWLESIKAVNEKTAKNIQALRSTGAAIKICGAGGFTSGSGFGLVWHADSESVAHWAHKNKYPLLRIDQNPSPQDFLIS